MRVHVSFHPYDRDIAVEIAEGLRSIHHEPCFDNILEACGDLEGNYPSIVNRMKTYDYMIPVITENYLSDGWLQRELLSAFTYEYSLGSNFIIPVIISEIDLPATVTNPINIRDTDNNWLAELTERMNKTNQIFIIMKFGDKDLDAAYNQVFRTIGEGFNLVTLRVDEIEDSDFISPQVLKSISRSLLVIADLTDERPNCYYEVGYADAIGKPIILTSKKGETIHFDLAGRRIILWDSYDELELKVKRRLKSMQLKGLIPPH